MTEKAKLLSEMERTLPRSLPDDYRQFLLAPWIPDVGCFRPFHPDLAMDAQDGQALWKNFMMEWHPLGCALLPVEYLGEGCFACLHLLSSCNPEIPVILWDVTTDLGEQVPVTLGTCWTDYARRRQNGLQPLHELAGERRGRKLGAQKDLAISLGLFTRFVDWFHKEYEKDQKGKEFRHDTENRMPRYDAWRPERFCIQDHLMGVMGYRLSRLPGRIEVVGFTTRDHTNYARGSATKALLLGLLCEWAKQSCQGGVAFVEDWSSDTPSLKSIPYEILVFAYVLGVEIPRDATELPHQACRDLLLALTPFRADFKARLHESGSAVQACLAAHKQVLTTSQIEDLLIHCPLSEQLFLGAIQPEEQVRMAVLLDHLHLATMAGMVEQLVQVQAEEQGKSLQVERFDSDDPILSYSRVLQGDFQTILKGVAQGGVGDVSIDMKRPVLFLSWPVGKEELLRRLRSGKSAGMSQRIRQMGLGIETVMLVIPESSFMALPVEVQGRARALGAQVLLSSQTIEEIETAAFRCQDQIKRMRR